jgi:protocatechuate 3,4-dioxygenase beta subunit
MDGQDASSEGQRIAAELQSRLDLATPGRLRDAVRLIAEHAFAIAAALRATPAELDAVVQFLTDVGYATDTRRQEWVLLADVFGLSDGVLNRVGTAKAGITPSTLAGPFYRPDAPQLPLGADLCRNREGAPVIVRGRIIGVNGIGLAGAEVEVWHANSKGRYENQDPDSQPEHNLRGRFVTDSEGRFHFRTIRPGGYTLPDDGPVGQLARRLGLSLDRPAHIHFAVTAKGHQRLVTAIFDGSDPAIDRDALFAVKPGLVGQFQPDGDQTVLDVALLLACDDNPKPKTDQKG